MGVRPLVEKCPGFDTKVVIVEEVPDGTFIGCTLISVFRTYTCCHVS